MAQDTGLPDIQLDSAGLYREDIFTDRKAGTIRRLIPVTVDGSTDATRAVLFSGQTQLLTPNGVLPLGFEIPKVECVLINRPEEEASGAGETSITVIAGAIGNAIFDATGVRLRQIPFTAERVKEALRARA